jgi:hypothetical protein
VRWVQKIRKIRRSNHSHCREQVISKKCNRGLEASTYLNINSIESNRINSRSQVGVRERTLRRRSYIISKDKISRMLLNVIFGKSYFLLALLARLRILVTKAAKPLPEPPSISKSTLSSYQKLLPKKRVQTYPSRIASPKGRVELVPPKNRFQTVSANVCACASEVKLAKPVAPPRLIVTILPRA